MAGPLKESKWGQLLVPLLVGTVAAAFIWLGGAPEQAWLGYAAAGLAWSTGTTGRCVRWLTRSA